MVCECERSTRRERRKKWGGSLLMWKKFFGDNARIIGVDLYPETKKLEKQGFEIFIGTL